MLPGFAGTAAAEGGDDRGSMQDQDGGQGQVDPQKLLWLTGDHHIHTQYSPDAQYLVSQQVNKATQYGPVCVPRGRRAALLCTNNAFRWCRWSPWWCWVRWACRGVVGG